ncbi:hypothetical protein GCM10010840_26340 [Deinococcus aerolatus]|uniref:Uncharacterized protein n=1 Tax=Deinococcus aerolatus TaxID=522487 RepID=A0ABQ2GCS9_9DEIO|nr:hypothetical protein GCM10010840_26340 [Deinococcus aerolatus]
MKETPVLMPAAGKRRGEKEDGAGLDVAEVPVLTPKDTFRQGASSVKCGRRTIRRMGGEAQAPHGAVSPHLSQRPLVFPAAALTLHADGSRRRACTANALDSETDVGTFLGRDRRVKRAVYWA